MRHVDISWEPDAERFVATGIEGKQVVVNAPHVDDDAERTGIAPAELLLVAAGTCSAWDVVEILRKQRQAVEAIDVSVAGEQESEAPWTFTRIDLAFSIRGRGLNPEMVERAVRLSEEKYCSVTATIRRGAPVETSVEILETEGQAAAE